MKPTASSVMVAIPVALLLKNSTGIDSSNDGERIRLDSLYSFMQNMPPDGAALSAPEYMNILSHILWANGFPSGPARLDTSGLSLIRIEGEDGPQPLPDRASVQVVGCMTRSGSGWTLTMATDPVRARNTEEATEIELKAAGSKQLGGRTFELGNFFMLGRFDRDAHEGHKMLAKGALIRGSDSDRISPLCSELGGE